MRSVPGQPRGRKGFPVERNTGTGRAHSRRMWAGDAAAGHLCKQSGSGSSKRGSSTGVTVPAGGASVWMVRVVHEASGFPQGC